MTDCWSGIQPASTRTSAFARTEGQVADFANIIHPYWAKDQKIGLRTTNAKAIRSQRHQRSVKPSNIVAALCLPTRFTSGKS
jgi:hypothetical protein